MQPSIYREFVAWYPLLDPPEEHAAEAEVYATALKHAVDGPCANLLELGAGAGGNALHLKRQFACTLTDLSEPMLDLSRALNPQCEHMAGDMRTLRLGRVFDAVLVHDAIVYMSTVDDLRDALRTAFEHTRPGGAALIAPDDFRDDFVPGCEMLERDAGIRALRGLEWCWDPDPADDACRTDYVFALREGGQVTVVHEQHIEGLFHKDVWLRELRALGFEPQWVARPIGEGESDEVILCRRPA